MAHEDYTSIVGIDFSDVSNQALDQALEVTGLHAGEVHVVYVEPVEPPCPQCVARRAATNGAELWCARHAEHHVRAHTYSYVNDVLVGNSAAAYAATPERGA